MSDLGVVDALVSPRCSVESHDDRGWQAAREGFVRLNALMGSRHLAKSGLVRERGRARGRNGGRCGGLSLWTLIGAPVHPGS